ncbi:MAG: ParB N-terminal domain-containing protein, partial [Solirubrobacteraceae bacterium]
MTTNPALLPSPALFDVTAGAKQRPEGRIVRVPLEQIELAPNARKEISPEGIDRLAEMLARSGQLVPCIGHRPSRTGPAIVYAGQRRLLAARRSHELAGADTFDGLEP